MNLSLAGIPCKFLFLEHETNIDDYTPAPQDPHPSSNGDKIMMENGASLDFVPRDGVPGSSNCLSLFIYVISFYSHRPFIHQQAQIMVVGETTRRVP